MNETFLKIDQVIEMTKLSQSSIYRLEQLGQFPARIKLSERAIAWRESDIREWMATKSSKVTAAGGAK